jgi:hypothetical protein
MNVQMCGYANVQITNVQMRRLLVCKCVLELLILIKM